MPGERLLDPQTSQVVYEKERLANENWKTHQERREMKPHITTDADGVIQHEYWNGDKKLTVVFDTAPFALKIWGVNPSTEMEEVSFVTEEERQAVFEWLQDAPSE